MNAREEEKEIAAATERDGETERQAHTNWHMSTSSSTLKPRKTPPMQQWLVSSKLWYIQCYGISRYIIAWCGILCILSNDRL